MAVDLNNAVPGVLDLQQWSVVYHAETPEVHGTIRIASEAASPLVLDAFGEITDGGGVQMTVHHAGGWSPLGTSPFADLFTSPEFNGTLTCTPGVGLSMVAKAQFKQPLSILPSVALEGLDAATGPTLGVNLTLPEAAGNTSMVISVAALMQIADLPKLPL